MSNRQYVEAVLRLGAVLPDGYAGALRLKVHRFVRGGGSSIGAPTPNAVNSTMGEEKCECGSETARYSFVVIRLIIGVGE